MDLLPVESDELAVLRELLETARGDAQAVLDEHIDTDAMPETVEEFLELISCQQEKLAAIQSLEDKIRRLSSDNGSR